MRFYDPIILPDGRKLLTLRDAAEYIAALPKAEHVLPEVAMETLLKAPPRRLLLLLNTAQIIDNSEDACSHDDFRA